MNEWQPLFQIIQLGTTYDLELWTEYKGIRLYKWDHMVLTDINGKQYTGKHPDVYKPRWRLKQEQINIQDLTEGQYAIDDYNHYWHKVKSGILQLAETKIESFSDAELKNMDFKVNLNNAAADQFQYYHYTMRRK